MQYHKKNNKTQQAITSTQYSSNNHIKHGHKFTYFDQTFKIIRFLKYTEHKKLSRKSTILNTQLDLAQGR